MPSKFFEKISTLVTNLKNGANWLLSRGIVKVTFIILLALCGAIYWVMQREMSVEIVVNHTNSEKETFPIKRKKVVCRKLKSDGHSGQQPVTGKKIEPREGWSIDPQSIKLGDIIPSGRHMSGTTPVMSLNTADETGFTVNAVFWAEGAVFPRKRNAGIIGYAAYTEYRLKDIDSSTTTATVSIGNRKPEAYIELPTSAKQPNLVTAIFPNGEIATLEKPGKSDKRISYYYDAEAKRVMIIYHPRSPWLIFQ